MIFERFNAPLMNVGYLLQLPVEPKKKTPRSPTDDIFINGRYHPSPHPAPSLSPLTSPMFSSSKYSPPINLIFE